MATRKKPLTRAPKPPEPKDGQAVDLNQRLGRPFAVEKTKATIATLIKCGQAQFPMEEAAAWIGTTAKTLREFFRRHPDVQTLFEAARAQGLGNLRLRQMTAALAGDAQMLKWLGKQYLNQKDKMEVGAAGDTLNSPEDARDKLAAALATLTAGEPIPAGESKGSKRLN